MAGLLVLACLGGTILGIGLIVLSLHLMDESRREAARNAVFLHRIQRQFPGTIADEITTHLKHVKRHKK